MHLKFIAAVGIMLLSVSADLFAANSWYEGVVVLKDRTVINGRLSLNMDMNIVQVKKDNKIQAYSAFQVDLFYINDHNIGHLRKYISRPYEVRNKVFADIFLEEIIKGDISLLRKVDEFSSGYEPLEEKVYTTSGSLIDNHQYQDAMSYDYFFEMEGEIVHCDRFKNDLLPLLENKYSKDKIDEHVDKERINVNRLYDQIMLIKFCNKIKQSKKVFTAL